MKLLAGKKTYIAAVAMIVLGIVNQTPDLILEGLAILFLRQGVAAAVKQP
jgi:hypothetical protein